jgi:hypothetical protein
MMMRPRGYCGNTLRVSSSSNTYACNMSNHDQYGCPSFAIMTHILDQAAWNKVEAVLTRPDVIAAELARLRESDPVQADLVAIERQMTDVARKQHMALRALGVEARVWRSDHTPRFEITMQVELIVDPTTHRCNAGRCRTDAAASRGR